MFAVGRKIGPGVTLSTRNIGAKETIRVSTINIFNNRVNSVVDHARSW